MVALGNISGWQPPDGPVTTWMASPAASEAARAARRSDTPSTYQRAQHLRKAYNGKATGRRLPRLMIVAWDIPGVCDIPAMTATINTHVRRHDAYHDWFEYDNGVFVRRMIDNPAVIDFVPVEFGHMNTEEDSRTRIDDDAGDARVGLLHVRHRGARRLLHVLRQCRPSPHRRHLRRADLLRHSPDVPPPDDGRGPKRAHQLPQVRSYRDYAARQHDKLAGLTASSPETRDWIDFLQDADGDWPSFPLPLGDTQGDNRGGFVTVELLNGVDTEAFDTACRAAGARFIGGVLACGALAERELTGTETFHGFTPYDTRKPGVDAMTVGWFASLFPVTVPTSGGSFPEAAQAAQTRSTPPSTLPTFRLTGFWSWRHRLESRSSHPCVRQ